MYDAQKLKEIHKILCNEDLCAEQMLSDIGVVIDEPSDKEYVYLLTESSRRPDGCFDPQYDCTVTLGVFHSLDDAKKKRDDRTNEIVNGAVGNIVYDHSDTNRDINTYLDDECHNGDVDYTLEICEMEVE